MTLRALSLVWVLSAVVFPRTVAQGATAQNFKDPGTPYTTSVCGQAATPAIHAGGPGGGNFLRLIRGLDFASTNAVGFDRSDPGGFTGAVIEFDFRITPGMGRADGMGVVLLNTGLHGKNGAPPCLTGEEPNVPGSLGIGLDIFHNAPGEPDNNHVSVHFGGAVLAQVPLGNRIDLASSQWIRVRIEVRAGGGRADVGVVLVPQGGEPVTVITELVVPGLVPYESRLYLSARTGGQTADHDIANVTVAYSGDPAVVGQWGPVIDTPVVPVHSALLPTGKVLYFDRLAHHSDTVPRLWDPVSGAVTETPHPGAELFCSGHTFDGQGRLLLFGGHNMGDGFGLDTTFSYDHATGQFQTLPPMNAGRWYPTAATLGNGDTLVIAGTITPGVENRLPQVFETRRGGYRDLPNASRSLPYYPMMFLAPDGRIFNAGPNIDSAFLDPGGNGGWSAIMWSNYGFREYGTAVQYDVGKVMLIGGGYVTGSVELIDLTAAAPRWQYSTPMSFARRQHNALILPDGQVLVTGGSSTPEFQHAHGAVFATEIWDPRQATWAVGAGMARPRLYHSESVLLPDGRVASLGGGHPAAPGGQDEYNLEIYSPPYLFRGPRPALTAAPSSAAHGQTFTIESPDAASIRQINLLRPSAVTHTVNMDQRIVRLDFSRDPGSSTLRATLPDNPNLAPPGPYLLFLLNESGVPSIAHMLSVQSAYQQGAGPLGLVSIELERHHAKVAAGGARWDTVSVAGSSGTGALQALPDSGVERDAGFSSNSPRVDYWVNFNRTGTHHVWVRGAAATSGDDTVHVGLDRMASPTADRISGFGPALSWSRATLDGTTATLEVATPGLHLVSVWMREDGFVADKLVLSPQLLYLPIQDGPPESAQP